MGYKITKLMERLQNKKILQKYENETMMLLKKRTEIANEENGEEIKNPQKRDYRMRAHCNPLSITPFPLYYKQSVKSSLRRLVNTFPCILSKI